MHPNLQLMQKCRGKKLTGVKKLQTDPFCDEYQDGFILTFGENLCLEFFSSGDGILKINNLSEKK